MDNRKCISKMYFGNEGLWCGCIQLCLNVLQRSDLQQIILQPTITDRNSGSQLLS